MKFIMIVVTAIIIVGCNTQSKKLLQINTDSIALIKRDSIMGDSVLHFVKRVLSLKEPWHNKMSFEVGRFYDSGYSIQEYTLSRDSTHNMTSGWYWFYPKRGRLTKTMTSIREDEEEIKYDTSKLKY